MQSLPIDTSRVRFRVLSEPVAHKEFGTESQKITSDGQPVFKLRVLVSTEDGGEVVWVKVPGYPSGVDLDDLVEVEGLRVVPWAMGNQSGVAFWCDRIEVVA